MRGVTQILDRVQQGDPKAAEELVPLVYQELRKLAAAKMAQQSSGQTLQATALEMLKIEGSAFQKQLPPVFLPHVDLVLFACSRGGVCAPIPL